MGSTASEGALAVRWASLENPVATSASVVPFSIFFRRIVVESLSPYCRPRISGEIKHHPGVISPT